MIRRFSFVWWGLIAACMLGMVWQVRHIAAIGSVLRPLPGGIYTEGVAGQIKTINPVLPDNSASADASRLIFDGLTKFNSQGQLKGDLASSWNVSADGKTYTFKLHKGVTWHDGVPFTAQDVLFTLAVIQNPDSRSPLAPNWKGVKATAPDDNTVVYTLSKPYTPFIYATTVGILPQHLLQNIEPKTLRVIGFNQKPVGTGPFKLDSFDTETGELSLKSNQQYFGGKPLLNGVKLRTYSNDEKVFEAYQRRQVMGVSGLQSTQADAAMKLGSLHLYEAAVPDQVAVFLHTSGGVMADKSVREGLATGTNRQEIITGILNGQATPLASPVPGSIAHQASFNLDKANSTLEAAGWVKNKDGVRQKGDQLLEIKLVTQSGTIYGAVAQQLAGQWGKLGVRTHVLELDAATLQQSYIRTRHYDALLYGINTGSDPDVYAFWHSSQASDPGLNLSTYSSTAADKSLEAGRTIRDNQTRLAKYRSFAQTWAGDNPAIMLYSPAYIYAVDRNVHGIHVSKLVTPADRFDGIENWSLKVKAVPAN
jgi:peptide/nickel transport system substrate-binding protein